MRNNQWAQIKFEIINSTVNSWATNGSLSGKNPIFSYKISLQQSYKGLIRPTTTDISLISPNTSTSSVGEARFTLQNYNANYMQATLIDGSKGRLVMDGNIAQVVGLKSGERGQIKIFLKKAIMNKRRDRYY